MFSVNEKYQEHPRYIALIEFVKQGLVFGKLQDFILVKAGSYFTTPNGDIWKKLHAQTIIENPYHGNALTWDIRGMKYKTFSPNEVVTELTFKKGMNALEDILKIKVRPQKPEHEKVTDITVNCIGYTVDFTLDDEGPTNKCSVKLRIGNQVIYFGENDEVEVEVPGGEKLLIVPITPTICGGLLTQIKGGSSDWVITPIFLGSKLTVDVTKEVKPE